jgi:hypothetical protein
MTRRSLILVLALALILVGAAYLVVARLSGPALPAMPTEVQSLERQDLAPVLRRRIEQALAVDGLTTAPATIVRVAPADCPQACNAGMDRGLCYCLRDASDTCPAGWPLERGDSRSACASLPTRVTVQPEGPDSETIEVSF